MMREDATSPESRGTDDGEKSQENTHYFDKDIPQQCDEPSDLVETSKWGPAEHVMKMWYRFTFPRQEGQLHNLEGSFFLTFQVHQRSQ